MTIFNAKLRQNGLGLSAPSRHQDMGCHLLSSGGGPGNKHTCPSGQVGGIIINSLILLMGKLETEVRHFPEVTHVKMTLAV